MGKFMGKYASVVGIFLIGVVVVIVGVYLFLTGGSDTTSFQIASAVTLVGLLVTGIGAIKGKRAMKSIGYFAAYPSESHARQVSQSRDRFLQSRQAQQVMDQAETHHVEQGNMTPGSGSQAPAQVVSATSESGGRPTPSRPATQLSRSSSAMDVTGPGGTPKIVKVLVCSGCGTENQDTDTFCSSCGKKIRPKVSKSGSTKAASKKKIKATKKVNKTKKK